MPKIFNNNKFYTDEYKNGFIIDKKRSWSIRIAAAQAQVKQPR